MMNKEIIAIDFDGTLVTDEYPDIGSINQDLIDFIKNNRDKYIFILNTLRKGVYLEQAISFLKDVCEVEFDYINENTDELILKYGNSRKIAATYYIDDRNLTLSNWKQVLLNQNNIQEGVNK